MQVIRRFLRPFCLFFLIMFLVLPTFDDNIFSYSPINRMQKKIHILELTRVLLFNFFFSFNTSYIFVSICWNSFGVLRYQASRTLYEYISIYHPYDTRYQEFFQFLYFLILRLGFERKQIKDCLEITETNSRIVRKLFVIFSFLKPAAGCLGLVVT